MIKIIGAGPTGNFAGYLLAKKGYNVEIFEEHKNIGKPVACTGLVTSQIKKIISMNNGFIKNKCKKIRINYKNNSITFKLHQPNYVIDREKFDKYFFDIAKTEGVKYNLGSKINHLSTKDLFIKNKKIKFDLLIGADGPNTIVGRFINQRKQKILIGAQARIKIEHDPKIIDVWLDYGKFSWLVPEDEKYARIGVVDENLAGMKLKLLFKRLEIKKIIEWQSGIIPIYSPFWNIQKRNILLIGDAAGQVKATTYGGLVHGLEAAKILSENPKRYSYNVKKKVGIDLIFSLLLRKMLDNFSEKDYNQLFNYLKSNKILSVLEKYDRDYPKKFLLKLLKKEPRLIFFIKKIFY